MFCQAILLRVTNHMHHHIAICCRRVLCADVPSWACCESGGEIPWDEAAYVKENEANTLGLQLYYVVKIATLCLLSEYRYTRMSHLLPFPVVDLVSFQSKARAFHCLAECEE
jgi:hypothetical protein